MAWNDFSEVKPKKDGCYLVFSEASRCGDGYHDHIDMACYSTMHGEFDNDFNWLVTHWHKLPEFPVIS